MAIEKLPNICQNLELVSIYNVDGTTTQELVYKLGLKINELVREFNQDKHILSDSILEVHKTVEELLDKGLKDEVEQILIKWKQEGELSDILLDAITDIQLKVDSFDARITKTEIDILSLKSPIIVQLPVYETSKLDEIQGLKPGMIVFDSMRGKCILYKDSLNGWTNLDGTKLLEV